MPDVPGGCHRSERPLFHAIRGLFVLLDSADEGGGVVAADDILVFVDVFDEDEAAPSGGAEPKDAPLAEIEVEAVVAAEAVDAPKRDAEAHLAGLDETDVADVGEGKLDELHEAVYLDGVGGDAKKAESHRARRSSRKRNWGSVRMGSFIGYT